MCRQFNGGKWPWPRWVFRNATIQGILQAEPPAGVCICQTTAYCEEGAHQRPGLDGKVVVLCFGLRKTAMRIVSS